MAHQCNLNFRSFGPLALLGLRALLGPLALFGLLALPGLEAIALGGGTEEPSRMRGAASCSASGCHGGPRAGVSDPTALRGSEYPLWLERDPHARSWSTLNSPASIRILERLGVLVNDRIVNKEQFANCLACHNTSADNEIDGTIPRWTEGVGCEACHGPSEGWYASHYQSPDAVRNAIQHLGLYPTKPISERSAMCVRCHVGSADRDMNHDIIAAGHPALYFDMAVYHERLPKHWRDEGEDRPQRLDLWFTGQIAKARAELELIQARATHALPISQWPELAQYQCTSCHNRLDGVAPLLGQSAALASKPALVHTAAAPRRWNLEGLEVLAQSSEGRLETDALLPLLRERSSPRPSITSAAQRLLTATASHLGPPPETSSLSWNRERHSQWVASRLRQIQSDPEWEAASLTYIAVWAGLTDSREPKLVKPMETMRQGLVFTQNASLPVLPLENVPSDNPGNRIPTSDEWSKAVASIESLLERDLP